MSGINMFELKERLTREELQRRDSVKAVLAELKLAETVKPIDVMAIVKTAFAFATSNYRDLTDEEFEAGIAAGVGIDVVEYVKAQFTPKEAYRFNSGLDYGSPLPVPKRPKPVRVGDTITATIVPGMDFRNRRV